MPVGLGLVPVRLLLAQVARHLGIAQQRRNMTALIEALVADELQLGGELDLDAPGHFALQIGRIGAQRLKHRLLIAAQ